MRQRGAYVATETRFVNPHSQEISAENIDCDNEARQGAVGFVFTSGLLTLAKKCRPTNMGKSAFS
jgi:hypothetical protein